MVGGIRIMLRFQADGRTAIDRFAVDDVGTVQGNASVELNARFSGKNRHDATGNRVFQNSGFFRFFGNAFIQNKVVIVTVGELELFAVGAVIFADFLEFTEVERGVFNGFDTGWDKVLVNRVVIFSVNFELASRVEVFFGQVAGAEVKVGVIGKVANGWLVGKGNVMANQFVIVGKGVSNRTAHRSGESLFAVFAFKEERNAWSVRSDSRHGKIDLLVKPDFTAVQSNVVRRFVNFRIEFFPSQ